MLIVNITDTRNLLKELGLSVPVGNSDAGSYFNTKILEAVDYGVRLVSRLPFCVCSRSSNRWPMFTRGLLILPLLPEPNGRGTSSRTPTSTSQRHCQTSPICRSLRSAGQRWGVSFLVAHVNANGGTRRLPRTRNTRTMEDRPLVNRTFRPSWITSCVNRTRRESSISGSSSSMRSGRMTFTVVSRVTGACCTRSTYLVFLQSQTLTDSPHSKTLKGVTIPDCPI